jgi:hypothetical protein
VRTDTTMVGLDAAATANATSRAATATKLAVKVCLLAFIINGRKIACGLLTSHFFLVCRVGKESLVVQEPAIEAGGMTDAQLFEAANTDGTGNMSLEELAKYLGAPVDDPGLAEKFAK